MERVNLVNLVSADTFAIGVGPMDPQDDMALHRHDVVELVAIRGGAGSHRTRGGSFALARGDVYVVPVGMAHGYERCDGLHLVNLVFDPHRLQTALGRLEALPGYHALVSVEPGLRRHQDFAGHLRLDEASLEWLLRAIDDLGAEVRARAAGWEQAATALLTQILIRLARSYAAHDTPASRLVLRVGEVLKHIDGHLADELSLERLSAVGSVSKSTLQRCFRALFGASVNQHVIQRRIAAARELLEDGSLPVAEISRRVGIRDPNYFSRLFHRRAGAAPRVFRSTRRRSQR
jgi:AraC-like DNA-binding protein